MLNLHCQLLRLTRVAQLLPTLPTLLNQAAHQKRSYSAFRQTGLSTEVAATQEKHRIIRVQMARFPFHKTLDGFDWKAQPSIDFKVIKELATMRFVANGANARLLGPPGVGKTHLSVALGLEVCRLGLRVLFTTAAALINTLVKALYENRLEERLKNLTQPKLLIIDEIGYIPIDRQGANLFLQLVSRRYERGAILLTGNQSLDAWGEVFTDAVIGSAILDRLLHHATTVNIKGDSYRLREKRTAVLMRSTLSPHCELRASLVGNLRQLLVEEIAARWTAHGERVDCRVRRPSRNLRNPPRRLKSCRFDTEKFVLMKRVACMQVARLMLIPHNVAICDGGFPP